MTDEHLTDDGDTSEEADKSDQTVASTLSGTGSSGFDASAYPGGLRGCLEAILISADEPLTTAQIASVLSLDEEEAGRALAALADDLRSRGSGIAVLSSARGWRVGSARAYDPVVSAFLTDRHTAGTLSHAALEALAIIAYQQPVTRAEVTRVRGVASDSLVRSLILRGLVEESAPQDGSSARTLVTTDLFLERLGISALSELPPLAPFLPDRQEAMQEAEQADDRGRTDRTDVSRMLGSLEADSQEDDG
jgi:segregation and condensation protein B